MSAAWPTVRLRELLRRSTETVAVEPDRVYREVTIRLYGRGVVLRRQAVGAEIAAPRRNVVRTGQFILSRIDARNGAFGLVPPDLDGAVVSNDFPSFDVDTSRLDPAFLRWMSRTTGFVDRCIAASEGSTNRVRLVEARFLGESIPLPPLAEQRRIVARIERVESRLSAIEKLRSDIANETRFTLLAAYHEIVDSAPRVALGEVAPLVRRPIAVELGRSYPELGVRSFGRGTFHKPPLSGADVASKKLFAIEPGDLVFNIVFAWEGAVAVSQEQDRGRVGSHRFLTCVPHPDRAMADFLWFHFTTEEGLRQLGEASPGGAGRNRTLSIAAAQRLQVPVPPLQEQQRFCALMRGLGDVASQREQVDAKMAALVPSLLDRAFAGAL